MIEDAEPSGSLAVVIPVYNDWLCAQDLLNKIAIISGQLPPAKIVLVDDGSSEEARLNSSPWRGVFESVEIVRAGANLGHQRAICLGLTYVMESRASRLIVILDSDGEDDPTGIAKLLAELEGAADSEMRIAVAQRESRSANLRFRISYRIFKRLFRILTGKQMDFGNFSALTGPAAERLLFMPELWNHFPAAVMRSKIQLIKVRQARGQRFSGTSKMNFVALVNHGLAAISTFGDVVFSRLLIAISWALGVLVAAGVTIAVIRLVSDVAIPGWATAAMGFVLLALVQLLAFLAIMTFIQLSTRSRIPVTPRDAAPRFLCEIEQVYP